MKIFKNYFLFSNEIINKTYTKSNLTPNIDRVKHLKIFSNIVDNTNDDNFYQIYIYILIVM